MGKPSQEQLTEVLMELQVFLGQRRAQHTLLSQVREEGSDYYLGSSDAYLLCYYKLKELIAAAENTSNLESSSDT